MAYAHIYLSPHLDDAALSCGGAIARQAAAGERVLVLNICSGSPAPGAPFSPFAQEQHRKWDLPPGEAMLRRLAEDAAALRALAAEGRGLGLLDAIYRMPSAYVDDVTLFGPVAPGDPLADQLGAALPALLAESPDARLYAPLGVGGHVDHRATFAVAAALAAAGAPVVFYEDFPYVARPGALAARLRALGRAPAPAAVDIAATIDRKIAAIGAYASQLDVLFGGPAAMAAAVRAHGAEERFWALAQP